MFTYYLIKVAWGGDASVCARVAINLMLRGCQIIGKVLLQNRFKKEINHIKTVF